MRIWRSATIICLDFQAFQRRHLDSTARQFREEISAEIVGKNVDENDIPSFSIKYRRCVMTASIQNCR